VFCFTETSCWTTPKPSKHSIKPAQTVQPAFIATFLITNELPPQPNLLPLKKAPTANLLTDIYSTASNKHIPRRLSSTGIGKFTTIKTMSEHDLSATPMMNAEPKCFRIANVPSSWTKDNLLTTLKSIDPFLHGKIVELSLYPACSDSSETQIALLNMPNCTEYFRRLKSNDFNYIETSDGTLIVIDSHFHDLTPLNSPKGDIVAEFVHQVHQYFSNANSGLFVVW
jgi:hypothetical protein